MVIAVDKGIAMPVGKRVYPYKELEVGDSFFVPGGKLNLMCNYNFRASKRLGWKFAARKEEGGVRIWRMT